MKLSERSIISALRQRRYKLTPQRRAVIDAILTSQDHLTPSAIYRKVCQHNRGIGLVTVYRTLNILKELGLVCELRTGDSCPSYTISNPKHHHHLICSGCGKVIDFISPDSVKNDIDILAGRLSRESEFRIDDHLLEFTGLCRPCQELLTTIA